MAKKLTHHALERALVKLTLGTARDMERRRERSAELGLREGEQQLQIPIAGQAEQGITWVKKHIDFDFLFFEAPLQRDSELAFPQFTYGVAVEPVDKNEPPVPVVISCMFEFEQNNNGAIDGGWLHLGVHSPTSEPRDFKGMLHLTFQGFGTIRGEGSPTDGEL